MDRGDPTMPQFTVVALDGATADLLFPLVRIAAPEVSEQGWAAHVAALGPEAGLLCLLGPDGAPCGFLSYREEQRLRGGPVLHVDTFVTFELSRAAPGRKALCEAAEALARRRGCRALELRLPSRGYVDEAAKADGWTSLGHRLDAVLFSKSLLPA